MTRAEIVRNFRACHEKPKGLSPLEVRVRALVLEHIQAGPAREQQTLTLWRLSNDALWADLKALAKL